MLYCVILCYVMLSYLVVCMYAHMYEDQTKYTHVIVYIYTWVRLFWVSYPHLPLFQRGRSEAVICYDLSRTIVAEYTNYPLKL